MPNPSIDWAALQRRYARMSDEELLNLASDQDTLTPVAREVLFQQMSERDLRLGKPDALPAPTEGERFVRLHQLTDLAELLFLQKSLLSLDIEARIEDQELHTLEWFLIHEADGLSLFVRFKDVDRARDVLQHPFDSADAAAED
ncbi:MAG: hypothetical protein NVS9B15_18840 [Acidobacteriaceae bacterium]